MTHTHRLQSISARAGGTRHVSAQTKFNFFLLTPDLCYKARLEQSTAEMRIRLTGSGSSHTVKVTCSSPSAHEFIKPSLKLS